MSSSENSSRDFSLNFFFWTSSLFFQLFAISASTFLPLFWSSKGFPDYQIAEIDGLSFSFSIIGPVFAAYNLKRLSYRSFVSGSFFFASIGSFVLFWSSSIFLQISGLLFSLIGAGVCATLVPLSAVVLLSQSKFGAEYGKYRKMGSIGFLSGLLLSGLGADYFGALVYPLFVSFGFLCAAVLFSFVSFPDDSLLLKEEFRIRDIYRSKLKNQINSSSTLLIFGFSQLLIWSSFSQCFRYLPLRMTQMGSSAIFISITVSLLGIVAIFSIAWVGRISDKIGARYLWPIIPIFLSLRVAILSFPEDNFYWFIPMQILHIPTWVLNDILLVRFLRDRREELGALSISLLTQIGMTLGLGMGSYLMSFAIPVWGLKDSFFWVSLIPLICVPIFFLKWTHSTDLNLKNN